METDSLEVGTFFGFPVRIIIPADFTAEERDKIVRYYADETRKQSVEVDYLLARATGLNTKTYLV